MARLNMQTFRWLLRDCFMEFHDFVGHFWGIFSFVSPRLFFAVEQLIYEWKFCYFACIICCKQERKAFVFSQPKGNWTYLTDDMALASSKAAGGPLSPYWLTMWHRSIHIVLSHVIVPTICGGKSWEQKANPLTRSRLAAGSFCFRDLPIYISA